MQMDKMIVNKQINLSLFSPRLVIIGAFERFATVHPTSMNPPRTGRALLQTELNFYDPIQLFENFKFETSMEQVYKEGIRYVNSWGGNRVAWSEGTLSRYTMEDR